MKRFTEKWLRPSIAAEMRRRSAGGIYTGSVTPSNMSYIDECKCLYLPTGALLIFTRDTGHHSIAGWWKNPDYDHCFHLSLSYRDPETLKPRPRDPKESALWIEAFFGEYARWLWCEGPYSNVGREKEVWHYRLFTDPTWSPLLPRKEVYTTEFTERGWKSHSQLVAEGAFDAAS